MLREGMFIAERYEILDRIGSGGMSDVYKAKCHKLNRYVAIKVLKPEFSEDKTFVSKFRAEAQAAAGLMHANIVNVYDVGEENGIYYIVMELVEGITLKKYIDKKGILGVREAVSIAIQVAQGIDAAHKHNIVHRDIKPQNIIISKEGKVKVTDFGIARAASSNTINSSVMGSVHYISPEQARGGYSDEKSDIYSFGITLFEMLTGKVPFEGDTTVAVALQHIQDDMVSPREYVEEIPVSVEKIVLKCTQKKTERRYQSMSDLIADLKRSLVTPDEDFVVIGETLTSNAPTKMLGPEEMSEIAQKASVKPAGIDVINPNIHNEDNESETDDNTDLSDDNYSEEVSDSIDNDDDLDDIDDESEKNGTNKIDKVITILGIAIAVVIVIITIVVISKIAGLLKSGNKSNNPTKPNTTEASSEDVSGKVKVPNLIGYTEAEAKEKLNDASLGIKIIEDYSNDKETGTVIRQSINAEEYVPEHTTVIVTISKGSKIVEMPDLEGKPQEDAEKALSEKGLKYEGFQYIETDDLTKIGTVASTDPVAGTTLKSGDTVVVVLYKGKNEVLIKVPDFSDMTLEEAKKEADRLGFDKDNITATFEYDDKVEKDVVITQNGPKIGEEAPADSKIGLVVSLGKPIVPDIIGKTREEAEELLSKYTLEIGEVTEMYDIADAGKIIEITGYNTNDEVNVGTKINIVISKGEEPTEEPTDAPTEPETEAPTPTMAISVDSNRITSVLDKNTCDISRDIKFTYTLHYTNTSGNDATVTVAKVTYQAGETGDSYKEMIKNAPFNVSSEVDGAQLGSAKLIITIEYTDTENNDKKVDTDPIEVTIK